jgi:hypothetical protein
LVILNKIKILKKENPMRKAVPEDHPIINLDRKKLLSLGDGTTDQNDRMIGNNWDKKPPKSN